MSAFAQLSQRLSTLQETLRQTQALIERLPKLSIQPGSEPLDEEEGSARVELVQDIQDSLKQIHEDLELLTSDADELSIDSSTARRKDTPRDREREQVTSSIKHLEQDLAQSRARFRHAQLTAERASQAAKSQERALVFKNTVEVVETQEPVTKHKRQRTQQLSKDEVLANATSDVTSALRRTHDLLATELTRSRFAQETLEESTSQIKELGEKYTDLDSILANSRNLLSKLLRSQKSDTWYLETAIYILIATLIWLVFRRLLYGPFWRLPRFLWNVFAFLINWVVLRPLYLLLTVVGVIKTEPVPLKSATPTTRSRAPLIIQPSASDFPAQIPQAMVEQMREGAVPAGAGGAGAKVGQDPALAGKASEQIAQMVQKQNAEQQEKQPVRRGDGTVLQDRGDIPANPRKKVFEADAEDAQQKARKRDEL